MHSSLSLELSHGLWRAEENGHLLSGSWGAIDALTEEEQELEALVESLDKTCTRYKMEISAEKTKLMTNSANGIKREINVKGQ